MHVGGGRLALSNARRRKSPRGRAARTGVVPTRHAAHRLDRRCGRAGPLLLAARGATDCLLPRASRRGGPARARRHLEVRRGGGLRGAAVPVGAPPRDLPRPDGPALRPRRALDQPDLPGRCHRDRLRGPHTRTGVQDRGRRSVDLHRRRGCCDGLVLPRARRSDRSRARWPGRRQPGRGRAQPRTGAASGRRPSTAGSRVEGHWQRAPRHDRRCLGWSRGCRAGPLLPGVRASRARPPTGHLRLPVGRHHRRRSCGPGRPSRSSAHASGAACPRSRLGRSRGA